MLGAGGDAGKMATMIETYASADELADAASVALADALSTAIAVRGRASLVATGGRSPGPVFDRLAAMPMDWPRLTITLSDERCVDADHLDANQNAVRERLLQGEAAAARFLPLWPMPDPIRLSALLPFDAVMLGMGDDGHVASLIPGDPGLEDAMTTSDLTHRVPAGLGHPPLARITLTLRALLSARAIFLLIAGPAKREVIGRALAREDLPVRRLIAQSTAPVRIFWSL